MALAFQLRAVMIDGLRRASALACLATTYGFAVTGFKTTWLAAAVVCALVVATGPSQWGAPLPAPSSLKWPQSKELRLAFIPGWLLMSIAGACKAVGVPPRLVIWIWLAGAAWLLTKCRLMSRKGSIPPAGSGRWVWVSGLLVIGLAAALRLWSISTVPRDVHSDEGTITLKAQEFYSNPNRDWFAPPPRAGAYSIMNLHYALVGWGPLLFGFNLVGARISDVVLGTLSVGLLFDGLRRVANLHVAVVSALLLAANHCHLAFSRIASGYIQTAFVVALVFSLLSRVWTAPTYFNAALLGMVLALGIQTYPASLISLPLLVVVMAVLLLFLFRTHRRPLRVPLVILALTFVTAGAPFAVAIVQQGGELLGRSREINIFSPPVMDGLKQGVYHTESAVSVIAQQVWRALRGFQAGRDGQPQYGIHLPMADRYTAAFMVPGAVFVLLGLRSFVAVNALVFTLGYLWFGLGMHWAPGFNRTTGALPLGMAVAAVGLVQCAGTLWAGRGWLLHAGRDVTVTAGVALCVVANLHIYFVENGRSREWGDSPSEAGWVARRYVRDYTIHLVDWPLPGHNGLRLILGDLPVRLHGEATAVSYVQTVPVSGADLFIIDHEDSAALGAAMARFPSARVEEWRAHAIHGAKLWLVFVGQPGSARRSAEVDLRLHVPGVSQALRPGSHAAACASAAIQSASGDR